MGLKSGSSGDPYEEGEEEQETESAEQAVQREQSTDDATTSTMSSTSLPYVYRRDKVNEGRDQVPFFLRDHVRDGERDLRDAVEAALGEDVPKSDIREAAMLVAQQHPELVADELRTWGYDFDG